MPNREEKPKPMDRTSTERLELRYCQRCGALGVRQANAAAEMCGACARILQWICGEAGRATPHI